MTERGPARFLLSCGLVSVLLHALVFAAAPAQDRPAVKPPPRRPTSVMLVAQRSVAESLHGPTIGNGAPILANAVEPELTVVQSVASPLEEAPPPMNGAVTDSPGEGDYVPRPLPTVPPQPETPVMLTWPDFEGAKPLYQGVLALYIDDEGVVQRVRVMGGDLPLELEAQARAVFLGTRFAPGQLDGLAVRSRIQVEVVFEKPEPPLPAVRSLKH